MNVSKVMARFLPLMDLSILLLGMFLLVLSIAKFNEYKSERIVVFNGVIKDDSKQSYDAKKVLKQTLTLEFLPIYGCCNSSNGCLVGHCYSLDAQLNPGKEIRMDTDADYKELLQKSGFKEDNMPIVCLITISDGWLASGDSETVRKLGETWKCGRIYRIYNFADFPFKEE